MPTSSTVSVSSFSRYSETEPKVSFPTTPLHNNHLQTSELLTTDKTTTFTSSSVSTGRMSAAISASSSTSLETNHSILQIPPVKNTNLCAQNISRNGKYIFFHDRSYKFLLKQKQNDYFF
jgi:hypothetical protein